MDLGLRLFSQGSMVVDLPIVDYMDGVVLVGHGMIAACHVNNRESTHREDDPILFDEEPVVIGTARSDRRVHECNNVGIDRSFRERTDSENAAHNRTLTQRTR